MATIRDILNEQKWRHGALSSLRIVVLHRGAPGDRREVAGVRVRDIGPNGLTIEADLSTPESELIDADEGTAFIPYHRVLGIHDADGVVWRKEEP